jgi:hypothetical protein
MRKLIKTMLQLDGAEVCSTKDVRVTCATPVSFSYALRSLHLHSCTPCTRADAAVLAQKMSRFLC